MLTGGERANLALNISLHVFILFVFLVVFYFAYAEGLEQKSINKELHSVIDSQVSSVLDSFKKASGSKSELTRRFVPSRESLEKISSRLESESKDTKKTQWIRNNNMNLKTTAVIIALGLCLLFFIQWIIYRFILKKNDIHMKHVLLENLVLFSIIGGIEYLFFTKIATHFVPVMPDTLSTSVVERVQDDLAKI